MICLLLSIILSTGTYETESFGTVQNITVKTTKDNRITFDNLFYSDGKVCSLYTDIDIYTFNTEADLRKSWNPPFEAPRYQQRYSLTSKNCYSFERSWTTFTRFAVFLGFVGTVVEYFLYAICCRRRQRVTGTQNQIPQIVVTDEKASIKEKPDVKKAEEIVEEQFQNGEKCPLTQEPLDKTFLFVPSCGHVLSQAATFNLPKKCCICRRDVSYTRVEAKLTIVKKEETNPTNSVDSNYFVATQESL